MVLEIGCSCWSNKNKYKKRIPDFKKYMNELLNESFDNILFTKKSPNVEYEVRDLIYFVEKDYGAICILFK